MRFGGIVLLALLTLGACSSDPVPKEPKPSATTTEPTAVAPTMPTQAKKDTPSGAASFVTYYVDLVNHAAVSGDSTGMLDLAKGCRPCERYAAEFEKTPLDGERFSGTLWTINDMFVSGTRDPLEIDTKIRAREGAGTKNYTFRFVLTRHAPFRVADIYIPEEP